MSSCPDNYKFFADSFCFGSTNSESIVYSILVSLYLFSEIIIAKSFYKKSKLLEQQLCSYDSIYSYNDVTYSYLSKHILIWIRISMVLIILTRVLLILQFMVLDGYQYLYYSKIPLLEVINGLYLCKPTFLGHEFNLII